MKSFFAKSLLTALSLLIGAAAFAKDYTVTSPSGDLAMTISAEGRLVWSLAVKGETVLSDNPIALKLKDGRILGKLPKVRKAATASRVESIEAPFYRQAKFESAYNSLVLTFKDGWGLEVRAYDDGVAYRITTAFKEDFEITDETVSFSFAKSYKMLVPYFKSKTKDIYEFSFERPYTVRQDKVDTRLSYMPVYADLGGNGHLLLMESDLEDYPGIYLRDTEKGFRALFAPIPTDYTISNRGVKRPSEYGDIIAKSKGTRSFPWRIVGYAADEKDLPVNNMVYALASPSRLGDPSWIRTGLSSWDWWNGFRRHGVDFKSGINTETYLYDIDFASRFGLSYVIVDEGWYQNLDMMTPIEEMDIPKLCKEAADKGVGLMLWCTCGVLDKDLEGICAHYSELGVAGFKVDFFDAQDQPVVNQVYRIAETAAKYHLVLDLHGIYKPTGLCRTWPNIINFEGVFGLEQLKWCDLKKANMPKYDVTFPFIRMACGPVDYTPGALRNATRDDFRAVYLKPMSQGTRAHQVATYIVFDAPLAMLCDSPSDYIKEEETTRFIASIPTVFDKTSILSGKIGKRIVTLRQKGGRYYVGGLSYWKGGDIEVDFSFLPSGLWNVKCFQDGANADTVGEDYTIDFFKVTSQDRKTIHVAPGGGFAMIIE